VAARLRGSFHFLHFVTLEGGVPGCGEAAVAGLKAQALRLMPAAREVRVTARLAARATIKVTT
jgi:hypothetical protein